MGSDKNVASVTLANRRPGDLMNRRQFTGSDCDERLSGGLDLSRAAVDKLSASIDGIDSRFDILIGAMHDLNKRLSLIGDRVGR